MSSQNLPELISKMHNLWENRERHHYAKRERIPLERQGIWQVDEGIVRLSTFHENGNETLLGLAAPSMLFGQSLASVKPYEARTLTEVSLVWFSMEEIAADPQLTHSLFPILIEQLKQTEFLLDILSYRHVPDRLRHLLLWLKYNLGQNDSEGARIPVRLTHQDLANAIACSRVTVTRLLQEFKQEGSISFDHKQKLIIR